MVTLTYSGDRSAADAREDLRRWAQQMHRLAHRAGVGWCCIWRLEWTRAGRPHFHCLVWESTRWRPPAAVWRSRTSRDAVRAHARRLQARDSSTGPGDGRRWALQVACMTEAWVRYSEPGQNDVAAARLRCVDVRAVRNSRHAVSYCAKYVAKVNDGPEPPHSGPAAASMGRHWGVSGRRRMLEPVVRVALARSLTFPQVERLAAVCEAVGLTWLAGALSECRAQAWQFASLSEAWRLVQILTRERGGLWTVTTQP